MSNQKLVYLTEEFKFEKVEDKGKEKIILSGQAMPLNEKSRNGVYYRPESVKKAHQTLKNVAFLFNHNTEISLGHVLDVDLSKEGIQYKADLDPEEKNYIRKVERGDIRHVSVGCMVSNPEFNEETGEVTVDVEEFVELSLVPVPGFKNTSAYKGKEGALFLAEAFGQESLIEKLKEKKDDKEDEEEKDKDYDKDKEENVEKKEDEDEKESEDEDDKEKDKKEDYEEETPEEKMETICTKIDELYSKYDEIYNRIAVVETKIDAMIEGEENTESEDEVPEPVEETFETQDRPEPSEETEKLKNEAHKIVDKKPTINLNKVRFKNKSY